MPRVGVDATSVAPAGKGIARVQRKLVEALAALGRHDLVGYVRTPDAAALLAGIETVVVGPRKALAWEQLGMRKALRSLDVLVTTSERLPVGAERRIVVWLFELPTHRIAENRRTGAGWYQRGSDLLTTLLWRRSLRRAARVVTGSRATSSEIEATIPGLAGNVRVIYPGLDVPFRQTPGPRPEETGRYVFHLGSSDPRDNTETIVEAFRKVRSRLRDPVRLVVGGELGGRSFEDVETTGRLSDEDLAARYRGAVAYLDATLYEGFGYQPLEAMACGTPVIASSASSIPEVVGDAGLLCDPRSPDALADALVRVLEEPGLAAAMREKGLARAAEFSWKRTAAAFAEVIDEVAA